MEDVKDWLSTNGLGEYWPNFEEHGWEEISLLTEMSDMELEVCIQKAGHRAKFRKALRSFTNAATTPHTANSESSSPVQTHQNIPCELGADPRGETNPLTTSLVQMSETTAQLDRTESTDSVLDINETKTIETIKRLDATGTYAINVVSNFDQTHSTEISRDVIAVSGLSNNNRINREPNSTTSITNRNQVAGFGEERLESCDSNNMDMSLTTELAAVGHSYTVLDDTILEGPESHLMNRGPNHITIVKHSDNTTVNQGPTQLYVAPEVDETNYPVSILKGQMKMLADSHRGKDQLYVETKAFNELKPVIEEMHWGTLLGKPGDGKTATAAHLVLQYTDRGYEPVFLSSPRDWKMLISDSPSSKQVVLIDDMFGQSYLDDNHNVGKWKSMIENMSRIVEQRHGNLLVICTSRRHIFKDTESALSKYACFSKHALVDMTEEQFKLTVDEKVSILRKFAEAYTIKIDTVICHIPDIDPPHGFPHCVELYCTDVFLRKKGIAFLRKPANYVQREILNFRDNDRVKFLALLLVLYKREKLGHDTLNRLIENTTYDDKILFHTVGVSLETAIPDIRRALTVLTNTYLKQNNDGSYSFSQHSLREIIAFIYISENPPHAIQSLEFQHIVAFIGNLRGRNQSIVSNVSLSEILDNLLKRQEAFLEKLDNSLKRQEACLEKLDNLLKRLFNFDF